MIRALVFLGFVTALLVVMAAAGQAGSACLPRDKLAGVLGGAKWREDLIGSGEITSRGTPEGTFELFVDPGADGSWTLVHVGPDGRACMLAAGKGWKALRMGTPA